MARNASGVIVAGGIAQTMLDASSARQGYFIWNISTGDLWVNDFGEAATLDTPSVRIPAGGYHETPLGYGPWAAVSIIGATTGQKFTAREW